MVICRYYIIDLVTDIRVGLRPTAVSLYNIVYRYTVRLQCDRDVDKNARNPSQRMIAGCRRRDMTS